jgi:hypothetical protein
VCIIHPWISCLLLSPTLEKQERKHNFFALQPWLCGAMPRVKICNRWRSVIDRVDVCWRLKSAARVVLLLLVETLESNVKAMRTTQSRASSSTIVAVEWEQLFQIQFFLLWQSYFVCSGKKNKIFFLEVSCRIANISWMLLNCCVNLHVVAITALMRSFIFHHSSLFGAKESIFYLIYCLCAIRAP